MTCANTKWYIEEEQFNETMRLRRKFRPKCPACSSVLEKAKSAYLCTNSKCKVIKVHFDRSVRVDKIVYEGFDSLPIFGRKHKEEKD